ncbi:MAG: site-specific integrase [Clostridiaceae bacterium]
MSNKPKMSKKPTGIYQRGKTWSYTIYPTDVKTGLKKQKMVSGLPTVKAAVEAQAHARAEILSNNYIPDSSITLGKYLNNWFEGYKITLQPSTVQGYCNNIKLHIVPEIGYFKLSKLDRAAITSFTYKLLDKGLSPTTIKYVFSTLRKALNDAVYDDLISRNPCSGAKRPPTARFHSNVYNEQQAMLLCKSVLGTTIETEVLLSLFLGLRRGEALGLRFCDCNFETSQLRICQQITTIKPDYGHGSTFGIKPLKTEKSNRTIYAPKFIIDSILRRKAWVGAQKSLLGDDYLDHDLISCNPNGSLRNPQTLLKQFKKQIKSLGLPETRFHDLRHTCASLLLENDTQLKVISDLLGHSTLSTTADIYIDLLSKKNQPAEIMQAKFGDAF